MFVKKLFVILSTVGFALCGPLKTSGAFSYAKTNANPYIVGGEVVQGREFPSLVSVNLMHQKIHFCSGIILNSEWVLSTASGQWLGPDNVLVGTNQIDTGGTVHMIKETILHEGYNESDSWIHDIALLKLATPINFTDGVSPAVLPEQGEDTPVGSPGFIAGWGVLDYMSQVTANDLHKMEVSVYDHKKCEENYALYNKTVYPVQLCAAPKVWGNGPGFGDSADPLIVDGKAVALESWGRGNNAEDHPSVMIKISPYIDWINNHINS